MDLKELTSEEFQEELNKWFQDRGIIADLRSHLRHSMITALKNTRIGPKPTYKTSPKSQALDLLVAEYLLTQNCHYSLSVFTSEVPSLKSFTEITPGALFRNRKINSKLIPGISVENGRGDGYFKESEIEELLNALGISSTENQIKRISESYLSPENQESLLECLLKIIPEMSAKLRILGKTLQNCQFDGSRKGVSKEWTSQLTDILTQSRVKAYELNSLQESILRITETEISKIVEEESKKQMEILVEREKRIQENIKKHDDELLKRLTEAEKNLKSRREIIDEELSQRERHLSKMALEWKDRHDEIMRISANFQDVKSENQTLRIALEEIEMENQELNIRLQAQNKTVEDLQGQLAALISQLQVISVQKKENKPVDEVSKQKDFPVEEKEKSSKAKSHVRSKSESSIRKTENISKTLLSNLHDFSEEEKPTGISSDFSPLEEVVAEAWQRFRTLEKENDQIEKNYLEYKMKYSKAPSSESESSKISSPGKLPSTNVLISLDTPVSVPGMKSLSTGKENEPKEETPSPKPKKKEIKTKPVKKQIARSEAIVTPSVRLPTKRQSKDHSYFLESRSMLEKFHHDVHLKSSASSTMESSFPCSSSNEDSGSPSKKHVSFENPSSKKIYESTIMTPLRTSSFYCSEEKSTDAPQKTSDSREADSGLHTFQEPETKSDVINKSAKMSLRQQILMSDSDDILNLDLNEGSSKNSSKSPHGHQSSGNISVGKRSASDEDFWA